MTALPNQISIFSNSGNLRDPWNSKQQRSRRDGPPQVPNVVTEYRSGRGQARNRGQRATSIVQIEQQERARLVSEVTEDTDLVVIGRVDR